MRKAVNHRNAGETPNGGPRLSRGETRIQRPTAGIPAVVQSQPASPSVLRTPGPASNPAAAFEFLPAAGYRNNSGSANNRSSNGNYWSSSVNGNNGRNLNFNGGNANMNNNNRSNGNSVRCVQASGKPRRFCFPDHA